MNFVLSDAVAGSVGVGTLVAARPERIGARKLWIAFALESGGRITVDDGARRALLERGVSLLPAGVIDATGTFQPGQGVEVAGPDGEVFAKGVTQMSVGELQDVAGRQTGQLPEGMIHEVVHRDDLVIVP